MSSPPTPTRRDAGWLQWAWVAAPVLGIVGIVLVALSAPGSAPDAMPPAIPAPPGATAFTTTADGGSLRAPVPVTPASGGDPPTVRIDTGLTDQVIVGFGAALTHSSARVIADMPEEARASLLDELFSPSGPVRLAVLRVPIGASDFVDTDAFTFDDLPEGEQDWNLERFDIAPDRAAMIPVLQAVHEVNPDIRLIASPWSPPAWLKDSGSLEGGRLLDDDRAYDTYADYLVRFVEAYRDEGLDIDLLTVQNEPQLRHPDGYPGTDLPVWQAAELIERLGPALQDAGLGTGILGYDHNWELNPADAATTPDGEDPAYQYPADLLRTAAGRWLDGIAYHCYFGDAGAQSRLREQFPDVPIWVTECSGSRGADDSAEQAFADTLSWQAENLLIGSLRHHAAGVLTWNLALDPQNGPHRGGCELCSGVVTVSEGGAVARNAEYYILAHAASVLPPGSVRLAVEAEEPGVQPVAFLTPAGDVVVLVWNAADQAAAVSVEIDGEPVTVDLASRSLTTVVLAAGYLPR